MVDQLPAIVVMTPLFAALLVSLLGLWRPLFAYPVTVLGLGATLAASIQLFWQVLVDPDHKITYHLGGWDNPIPFGIHLGIDVINGLVLIVIAAVGLIACIYSLARVPEETPDKITAYYTLFLLLITGLLGMSISADAFNVYVLLEVASLTSYALIALGESKRGTMAAYHYVIMGTIGASFYLLGVGYLYATTGSLNMENIREIISTESWRALSRSALHSFSSSWVCS